MGRMNPVGLALALVAEVAAKEGLGVRLEVLAVLVGEAVVEGEGEDHHGDGDRRMGTALERLGTGGMVAHPAHYNPIRGAKIHVPVRRSLGVPKMDRKARGQGRRRQGWDRKSQR